MGRRLIQAYPQVVLALITEGNQWGGCEETIRVLEGVPADTQLVGAWFDQGLGRLCVLVEHPDWPVTDEIGLFPIILRREQPVPAVPEKEAPNGP